VDETDRMRMETDEFYLKSYDEMSEALPDDPEALDTTNEIANKCSVEIQFGVRRLPHFTAPDGMDNDVFLRKLCAEGMQRKMPNAGREAHDRLEYELSVIEKMGFVDYYLSSGISFITPRRTTSWSVPAEAAVRLRLPRISSTSPTLTR
ncbi:MAG: hypothetical protein II412_08755, partial [Clostridia bacterium]|nr:hypothetical protein [Clostridia bacterium]